MNKPAIVVICYNRPDSLKRLLGSIDKAKYPESEDVTLVISIDNSGEDAVANVAKEYKWTHGEKVIIERKERMGLKAHVLACGDLTAEYGSIIVLEDDLYVSPAFYEYSVQALDFTEGNDRIGGVSLYNHLFNVHARRSFTAIDDGYDNWYFQFASSWGQAYLKSQWDSFKEWMLTYDGQDIAKATVPANVSGWSAKSWLKYYIAYLIDTDRYFIYPRISYTTNYGDVGSHAVKADCDLQVPLAGLRNDKLRLSSLEESEAVYDAFFENTKLSGKDNDTIVDLYASKPVSELLGANDKIKFVISSASLPYKRIQTYGRLMRPVDANIVYATEGNDLYKYDVKIQDEIKPNGDEAASYLYEYRGISAKQMMQIIKYRIKEKLGNN